MGVEGDDALQQLEGDREQDDAGKQGPGAAVCERGLERLFEGDVRRCSRLHRVVPDPGEPDETAGVADLAAAAALTYGLPTDDVTALRRAGLVHDIGRLGVSNAIWDKPGELTQGELERVRLHPYLSARMLAFSPILAPLGAIAAQHHERLDGSGYPSGLSGESSPLRDGSSVLPMSTTR